MRLLFDQNLSPRLATSLSDLYPDSSHTELIGLGTTADEIVWDQAIVEKFVIVTKDADFNELSILRGVPPKVIWIRRGNCSTKAIASLLRKNYPAISAFNENTDVGVLTLF